MTLVSAPKQQINILNFQMRPLAAVSYGFSDKSLIQCQSVEPIKFFFQIYIYIYIYTNKIKVGRGQYEYYIIINI